MTDLLLDLAQDFARASLITAVAAAIWTYAVLSAWEIV